jgi:heterodisulfide reductase subunit A
MEKDRGIMMRIGVFICECGINIASTVNVEKATKLVKKFPNVVVSQNYKYMCSDPGQECMNQLFVLFLKNQV